MEIRQFQFDPAMRSILEERARQLATRDTAPDSIVGEEVLTFRLGNGRYNMPVQYVREVAPLRSHTPLPATPAFVVGLANVRGRLLTILDIRPLLGIAGGRPASDSFVLIADIHGTEVGLLADEVVEVRSGDRNLSPSLVSGSPNSVAWVRGVDSQLCLQIDPVGLLADPQLVIEAGGA